MCIAPKIKLKRRQELRLTQISVCWDTSQNVIMSQWIPEQGFKETVTMNECRHLLSNHPLPGKSWAMSNYAKVLKTIILTNCERLRVKRHTNLTYLKIVRTHDSTCPPMKYTAEKHEAGNSGTQHATSPYELAQHSSRGHVQVTGPE